ncbi:lipoprotein [Vibrio sp. S11_S32]|uniref:Lipoprotein n=1 Tax=Vibrio algicola TaxID=2662262 RepID=A0A5Q0T9Y9_9VIBR|nr:lipoprotein [Vibrio sp. S11_S32]
MKKHTLAWFALLVTTLAGCGQTGPLYLPQDQPEPSNTGAVSIKGKDGSVVVEPAQSAASSTIDPAASSAESTLDTQPQPSKTEAQSQPE